MVQLFAVLNDGKRIPRIGLGTYKLENFESAIDAALTAGYRLFDTAKYYKNEQELGETLEKLLPKHNLKREDIFLTTKVWPKMTDNSPATVDDVENSLKLLKVDYLDLVLIHQPKADARDNNDPENKNTRLEMWRALINLRDRGLIRSIGVSNFIDKHMIQFTEAGLEQPAVNQIELHPHFQRDDLVKYCHENSIFVQCYSPLARNRKELHETPVIAEIARSRGITSSQVILAWLLEEDHQGVIPKSSNPGRIAENFQAINIELSKFDLQRIDTLNCNKPYIRGEPWLVE